GPPGIPRGRWKGSSWALTGGAPMCSLKEKGSIPSTSGFTSQRPRARPRTSSPSTHPPRASMAMTWSCANGPASPVEKRLSLARGASATRRWPSEDRAPPHPPPLSHLAPPVVSLLSRLLSRQTLLSDRFLYATPAGIGLEADEIEFDASGGLKLRGW